MASAIPSHGLQGPFRVAKRITGWYLIVAVLFVMLGMFAIIEPGVAGLGVTLLVSWLLILGGIVHLVGAFKVAGARQVIFQLLIGIAYVIGGLYLRAHLLLAIGALTLLLAAVIWAEGVFEIISYFRLKDEDASGWVLFNGIVTLLLGALIWFHWPSSSVWAIGILVGVNLLMTGMTRLMFGLAARTVIKRAVG